MADDGGFVIAWGASQAGVPDNIMVRSFNPDGSPQTGTTTQGYQFGEILVNDPALGGTIAGNQMYPDVAMNSNGTSYVVTWQSSGSGTGWDVREQAVLPREHAADRYLRGEPSHRRNDR